MKLPPMNSLRAFEAVSRLGSVTAAAEELCVSQGAVSQQLRNLEDHLGQALFHRSANALTLSEDGEIFAGVVQQSLAQIAEAAIEVAKKNSTRSLKISAPGTLALKWLIPKLGSFYEKHPGVSVVVDESFELVTFQNDGFDAALRFADGRFEGLDSELLIQSEVVAAASPAYIDQYGELESVRNPEGHRLVEIRYDRKSYSAQHIHWADLIDGDMAKMDIVYQPFPNAWQAIYAACQGQGIVLAGYFLCEAEIVSGELMLQSEPICSYCNRYFLVAPSGRRPNPALDSFRDWLLEVSESLR